MATEMAPWSLYSASLMLVILPFALQILVIEDVFADITITFLHTNDMHSRIEEVDEFGSKCQTSDLAAGRCYGGIARISAKVKEIRKQITNVLLIDGGDQQTGTLWYDVFEGNATAHFVNKLNYNVVNMVFDPERYYHRIVNKFAGDRLAEDPWLPNIVSTSQRTQVLGNHDFDGGVAHMIKYLEKLNASVVMSNVNVTTEPSWPKKNIFKHSFGIPVGEEKVGFCGYVLKSTPRVSRTGPNIKFHDEIASVKECATKLTKMGINIIVAVGHSGIKMDQQIAKEVDEVDIVIGGHTNTFLYTGIPPSNDVPYGPYPIAVTKGNGKKSLVVQDFAYTKYLGYLNVTFDSRGDIVNWNGNPILLDHKTKQDADVLSDIAQMRGPLDRVGKVKIGKSLVFLDGEKTSCRLGECILGNLVTDAAVFHVASQTKTANAWTTASIALWTANSIMASIDVNKTGYIHYEDIKNSLPYNNKIDVVDLKGSVLLEVLEKSASFYDVKRPSGSFLQTSGLHLTIDTSKAINNRIIDVEARCGNCLIPVYSKLDKNKIYKVIVSSYMASGGAGYEMLRTKRLGFTPGLTLDTEAVIQFIKSRTPLFIETGNRLHIKRSSVTNSSGPTNQLAVFLLLFVLVATVNQATE